MKTEPPITEVLRRVIAQSGISHAALERATGVKRQSIMRFVRGDQTIYLDMADKLAAYFGLKLIKPERIRRKGK
jgi:plasmid maintenance system antidote protein VapI